MTFRPHPKQAEFMREPPRDVFVGHMTWGIDPAYRAHRRAMIQWVRRYWIEEAFRAGWQKYGRRLAADRRRAGR